MNALRQTWLVARREMRERIRSKGFQLGLVIMLLVVLASIVVPAIVETGAVKRDVGVAGAVPDGLPRAMTEQGAAVDVTVRVRHYDEVATGQQAVRDEDIDVLVVDARRLEWRSRTDERLRAVVTGAIQLVAAQQRAAAAGIDPGQLLAMVAPVPVENVELGMVGGRSPDDETAAYVMSILLLFAMATYGQLVLTGVVEEKSSRVVEVLLARMPARNLLAGKVAGIGLLGFAQLAVTAVAALVATVVVKSVDVPAISAGVLAWVMVWFVLGYALYATAYGALGSLASRTEDAASVAGPVTGALVVGYWASLMLVGRDPESGLAQLVSIVPVTAPFAMPSRIALGAVAWWEPMASVAVTLTVIAGLVVFAGRVYTGAILHTGATLKLRDAWHGAAVVGPTSAPGAPRTPRISLTTERLSGAALIGIAAAIGTAVAVAARDVILGVGVGAAFYAVATRVLKARTGKGDGHSAFGH